MNKIKINIIGGKIPTKGNWIIASIETSKQVFTLKNKSEEKIAQDLNGPKIFNNMSKYMMVISLSLSLSLSHTHTTTIAHKLKGDESNKFNKQEIHIFE